MSQRTLHLTTLSNDTIVRRLIVRLCGPRILDLLHYVHTINHLAENNMLVVQEGSGHSRYEELTAICVWAGVLLPISS